MSGRVVVIANRLPVGRSDDGWVTSPGGLVSATAPILREWTGSWVGWSCNRAHQRQAGKDNVFARGAGFIEDLDQ